MYIGKTPIVGNFQKCDAISVVNGQAAYTLQVGSTNVSPESVNHMIVSLNGVIQSPTTAYTVAGAVLTFDSNLATGDVIDFILLLGNVLDIGTPSDDTVTLAKLAAGTDGNIISYDASGNPVAIATGNDGQVLTSAGAGQPPAFETISAGTDGTPNFFAKLSGNQTISDQTLTKVTWDAEDFDSDSAFASNKFTVPSGEGGVYNFSVYYHTTGANRYMFCKVYKNGSLFAQNTGFDDNDDATGQSLSLSILMSLSATDYIETYIYTDTSGGGTVALVAADRASFFSGYRVA